MSAPVTRWIAATALAAGATVGLEFGGWQRLSGVAELLTYASMLTLVVTIAREREDHP